MQIDKLEIFEFYADAALIPKFRLRTLGKPKAFGDETDSFFETPDAELQVSSRSLSDLTDGQNDFFETFIAGWQELDHHESLLFALKQIANYIRDNVDRIEKDEVEEERVTDYVYPVV